MEWYFGSDNDDLVVPKDQEPLERVPSPESWSHWGVAASELSNFPKKNFCEVDMNSSRHNRVQSNDSNTRQGLYGHMWATTTNEQEYLFWEDEARTNHMDDIFFGSLLKDDPTSADNSNGSYIFATEATSCKIPADRSSKDMIFESNCIPRQAHSSECLGAHMLSSSVDWNKGEVSNTYSQAKGDSFEGGSMEAAYLQQSVLQELEMVTAQFTKKTRICFRDALYRLAENSKQMVNSNRYGDIVGPTELSGDDSMRKGDIQFTESRTNAIDRAIANLMFTQVNYENEDDEMTEQQMDCSFSQQYTSSCRYPSNMTYDAEVPVIGHVSLGIPNSG